MYTPPNTVTVWTLPSCIQCTATKRALDKYNVPYTERSATELTDEHKTALEALYGDTIYAAPIIETPNSEVWTGHRPDKLAQFKPKPSPSAPPTSPVPTLGTPTTSPRLH